MTFELVRGANSAPEKKLRYTPRLGDFSGDGLKIEFDFDHPLYVSAGDEPDKIVAQFTDPRLLLDPNTGMFIQTPGMITELPKMLLSDDATEVLGASCFLVASATNTMIVIFILIAFSLVAMTKSIWQFVNTIQMLAYLRWMVEWPANADLGYRCLDYSVSGRLQTDIAWNIYEIAMYGENWDKKLKSDVEGLPAFIDEQKNLPKALGVYTFLAVLILATMIYVLVLKHCKSKNLKMRRTYNLLNRKLYYNTLLRFALEIDLKLTHQAVSIIWFIGLSALQVSVLHGIFLILMIMLPIGVVSFLTRNRKKLDERKMVARYGTLYQGIKTDSWWTAIYNGVFLLRRLFMVCLVVFAND